MNTPYNYVTKLDVKFDHLQRIDVAQIVSECTDQWFNQTLTQVNDSVVRLVTHVDFTGTHLAEFEMKLNAIPSFTAVSF